MQETSNLSMSDPAELEKKRLELEIRKLSLEEAKTRWTAISTVVPIVVALLTVAYGAWSLHQTAKMQFGTKLAEVAMQNSRNEYDSLIRAKLVGSMFGDYVDKDFLKRLNSVDPKKLGVDPRDWQYEPKNMVLQLLAQHPEERKFILAAYEKLYVKDQFPRDLEGLVNSPSESTRNASH